MKATEIKNHFIPRIKVIRHHLFLLIFFIGTGINSFAQAIISIDKNKTLQVIDGFGGYNGGYPAGQTPPGLESFLMDDLGITILRMSTDLDFEKVNDNNDPDVWDSTQAPVTPAFSNNLEFLKGMKKAGGPGKLIISTWSPPGWMKSDCGKVDCPWASYCQCDGYVASDNNILEFAEWWVAQIKIIKRHTGVDVYAISLQNELEFAEPYGGAVYTPQQWVKIVNGVGARLKKEGLNTKIFGAEAVINPINYFVAAGRDTAAIKYWSIAALHNYNGDGVTSSSPAAQTWASQLNVARKFKKPFWMSETSGFYNTWDDAFKLAKVIYGGLKFGELSAWMWWTLNGETPDHPERMFSGAQHSLKSYVSKNYYRFIRPGALGVEAISNDSTILSLAFQHNQDSTLTVVLINTNETSQTVNLNVMNGMSNPKEYSRFLTDAGGGNSLEKISASSVITLAPSSILTLYGQGSSTKVVTGINESNSFIKEEVFIHPNPTMQDNFTITYTSQSAKEIEIQIVDILGRLNRIINVSLIEGNNEILIDTRNMAKGIYLVKTGSSIQKVIISQN